MNRYLPTPDRESRRDQSKDTTKVQLGEPVGLTEVTYRSRGKELFTRVEMTQRP